MMRRSVPYFLQTSGLEILTDDNFIRKSYVEPINHYRQILENKSKSRVRSLSNFQGIFKRQSIVSILRNFVHLIFSEIALGDCYINWHTFGL